MVLIRNKDIKSIGLKTITNLAISLGIELQTPYHSSTSPYSCLIASDYNGVDYYIKCFDKREEAKEFLEHIIDNFVSDGWLTCDGIVWRGKYERTV